MKKLVGIFFLMLALGCQKVELIEEDSEARSDISQEDTTEVDVGVDIIPEGWEGSIDVGFGFG